MNLQIPGWDRIPTLAWIQKNKQTKTKYACKKKFKYIPSDEKETPFDLTHFFGGYGTKNPFEDWTGVAMRESW